MARLSKPGEKARRSSRLARFLPREGSSVSATERTWALRPPQGDDSVVVAVSMYKAVNKATPSKGAAGVSSLVIRRQPAATLQGATSPWRAPRALAEPARHPGWSVPLFSFGDAALCHGPRLGFPILWCTTLYCAPHFIVHRASSFVTMWYPFPPRHFEG